LYAKICRYTTIPEIPQIVSLRTLHVGISRIKELADYLHIIFQMKKVGIFLLTLLFCAAFAHGGVPFKVITEDPPDPSFCDTLSISIVLNDGTLLPLGYTTQPSVLEHGVDPKTIKVEILPGNENLLHITWSTYYEGQGGYKSDFSIITLGKNPSKTILKRQFFVSGHSGQSESWKGRHRITYKDSILKVFYQTLNWAVSEVPKIGSSPLAGHPTLYETTQEFILVEKYKIPDGRIELEETIQNYKILKGDNLKRICKIMEWEPEWIQNSKPLIAGKWLTAKIPYGVAVLRCPAIAKFED
jgi:hypothetical protein